MLDSGSYKTCSGSFYNGGGASRDYIGGQDVTVTSYPEDPVNQKLSMTFTSFSTYNANDWLRVYNGSRQRPPKKRFYLARWR